MGDDGLGEGVKEEGFLGGSEGERCREGDVEGQSGAEGGGKEGMDFVVGVGVRGLDDGEKVGQVGEFCGVRVPSSVLVRGFDGGYWHIFL